MAIWYSWHRHVDVLTTLAISRGHFAQQVCLTALFVDEALFMAGIAHSYAGVTNCLQRSSTILPSRASSTPQHYHENSILDGEAVVLDKGWGRLRTIEVCSRTTSRSLTTIPSKSSARFVFDLVKATLRSIESGNGRSLMTQRKSAPSPQHLEPTEGSSTTKYSRSAQRASGHAASTRL